MQAEFKPNTDDKDLGLRNSFTTATLELYKVSGKLEGGHELQTSKIQLNKFNARNAAPPSLIITPSGEIKGSVLIYTDEGWTLNWFFT